jgi:site-specific recombinase XerD
VRPLRVDFPYLMADTDRHGNRRYYVRKSRHKVRIRERLGTEAFASAYSDALRAIDTGLATRPGGPKRALPGTLGWLAAAYFGSADFQRLDSVSRRTRRQIIESCLGEPRKPGSPDLMRDCPVSLLGPAHIRMLRDRRASHPGAANNRKKYLSSMFAWAIECNHMHHNPARDVKRLKYATSGFHTWTIDEVSQFAERHPIGTKPMLALALLLFLGVRRGDVVRLGPLQRQGEIIRMIPKKTSYLRQDVSAKPVLPILANIIDQSPAGKTMYLETEYGRPFTAAGFGNWFRERCDEAGLRQCSAHGLRKAGAAIAAENGATDRQLMAMYDWTTEKQATVYTAAASRKLLAADAAKALGADQIANVKMSHLLPHRTKSDDAATG